MVHDGKAIGEHNPIEFAMAIDLLNGGPSFRTNADPLGIARTPKFFEGTISAEDIIESLLPILLVLGRSQVFVRIVNG